MRVYRSNLTVTVDVLVMLPTCQIYRAVPQGSGSSNSNLRIFQLSTFRADAFKSSPLCMSFTEDLTTCVFLGSDGRSYLSDKPMTKK